MYLHQYVCINQLDSLSFWIKGSECCQLCTNRPHPFCLKHLFSQNVNIFIDKFTFWDYNLLG
nr:MAG TPA: hypothetical protein [Caudoviricetes sp.]